MSTHSAPLPGAMHTATTVKIFLGYAGVLTAAGIAAFLVLPYSKLASIGIAVSVLIRVMHGATGE